MSRARPFYDKRNGDYIWFDQKSRATVDQLELLADYEDVPLDDLLDEGLTQKQLLLRLRIANNENLIPPEVIERRRFRREEEHAISVCRICATHGWQCEGRITRHHFIPRWLMKELDDYESYSSRSLCTIPICLGRHRDLHYRGDGTPKTIVPYLRDHERMFAQMIIDRLKEQRPAIFDLLIRGDHETYEGQLIKDYLAGSLTASQNPYMISENQGCVSNVGF